MTNIKIFITKGQIIAFEVSGHTGKAFFGQDVLCSAISALTQTAVLGVREVVGLKPTVKIKDGFLFFRLKEADYENRDAQIILKTMERALTELMKTEKKYMKMEVENV